MEVRYENGWTGNGWLVDRMNRMNGIFSELNQAPRHMRPAVDVVEDKDSYHFFFEMPGLKSESLDVKVENDTLTVTAERKRPEWPKETEVHIAERGYGRFYRAFQLPEDANHEKINASYRDGVLELTVEKRPEAKPVKIQIN
jgi:HSP20 family protein